MSVVPATQPSNSWGFNEIYEAGKEFGRRRRRKYNELAMDEQTQAWYDETQPKAKKKKSKPRNLPKNKMTGTNAANNVLVNKSSMVVRGKNKLKRRKVLKLSSYFKQGVKQVMSGTTARGTYTTLKQGFVGSITNNGSNFFLDTSDIGGTHNVIAGPGTSNPTGSRTLFNALVAHNPGDEPDVIARTGFNYFTPAKIWDAASILFNNKAPGDPYSTTGNLTETVGATNGQVVTSLPTLKIEVINSSVVWRMKNLSNRVITLDIWECSSTLKFANVPPLQGLLGLAALVTTTSNNNPIKYLINGTENQAWYLEQGMDPLATAKQYGGFPWTWKKRTMIMQPSETCIHTIKGPSGILDFRKLIAVSSTATNTVSVNNLLKGFSVGCIVSVHGDQVLKPDVNNGVGGRDAFTGADADDVLLGMPVSIEIEEKYRIAVPEIAGYLSPTPLASGVQQLNLRKHRYIFNNTIGTQAPTEAATTGYQVANEENPIEKSAQNLWYQ